MSNTAKPISHLEKKNVCIDHQVLLLAVCNVFNIIGICIFFMSIIRINLPCFYDNALTVGRKYPLISTYTWCIFLFYDKKKLCLEMLGTKTHAYNQGFEKLLVKGAFPFTCLNLNISLLNVLFCPTFWYLS